MVFQITWPDIGFYKDFFTNLQEGLQQEKVMSSPSECAAVVSAFMECLRFALLHTGVPSSEASCVMRERQQYLIDNQVKNRPLSSNASVPVNNNLKWRLGAKFSYICCIFFLHEEFLW